MRLILLAQVALLLALLLGMDLRFYIVGSLATMGAGFIVWWRDVINSEYIRPGSTIKVSVPGADKKDKAQ